MPSKISLVNKEIGKNIVKSVGWVAIVYFLGLFFSIPLEILMNASEEQRQYVRAENLFQFHFEIQLVLNIGIPVLLAIFLFRYLQVKPYSDLMHSLPVKREKIFHQYAIAGFTLIILPVFLNTLIVLALYKPLGLADFFTAADILTWMGITILCNLFIYMAGVFVGMVTGLSAVQGVLTYIILLLPIGLLILLTFNLPFYLYGFPKEYFMNSKILGFSPLVAAGLLDERTLGKTEILIYLILTVVLYGLSLWIYKKRKLEAVSQALVFPVLKPIFKYGTVFCMMLFGGMYFGEIQGGTSWLIAGYVLGAILGYLIAEMVLQKSWRVHIHLKGLAIYAGAMAILVFLFQFDLTHYEKRIPKVNEIERIHFSEGYYIFEDSRVSDRELYLQESDNIDLVRRFHKTIVTNHKQDQENTNNLKGAFIVYDLNNGEKLVRHYEIDKNQYAPFLKLIYESDEFKQKTNEIFQVKTEQADKISISPFGPVKEQAIITEPDDLKEAIDILKEEVNSETYEDSLSEKEPYAYVEISYGDNKTASMEWRASYTKFEEWLDQKGMLDEAKVNAEDINYAIVVRKEDINIDIANGFSHEELFNEMKKNNHALKVTEKEKIELSLENAHSFVDGDYIVGFYFKEHKAVEIKNFNGKNIPNFVKEYFR